MPPPQIQPQSSQQPPQQQMFQQQQQPQWQSPQSISQNLCEKHFPEPIIYFLERESLCKKCLPVYMSNKNKHKKKKLSDNQTEMLANMLGFSSVVQQTYQAEKN